MSRDDIKTLDLIEDHVRNIIKFNNLRPGQQKAIKTILENISSGKQTTAVVMATRYGKSDVCRLGAKLSNNLGYTSAAFILTTTFNLREQMADKIKIGQMMSRYNTGSYNVARVSSEDFNIITNSYKEVNCFVSTIQLIANKQTKKTTTTLDKIISFIKKTIFETGKPPVFFIDESHCSSVENTWGEIINALINAGAFVVLLTATPSRTDGSLIPGFDYEEIGPEITVKSASFFKLDDEHLEKTIKTTIYKKYQMKADCTVPFSQAWREGALMRLEMETFDAWVDTHKGELLLSTITHEKTARAAIKKVVRDEKAICKGLDLATEHYEYLKSTYQGKRFSIIVFCDNAEYDGVDDREEAENNQHAKQIERIIHQRYDNKYNVKIITSDDPAAAENLQNFVNNTETVPTDIIIVKQMASIGLDVDHTKIGLDLSGIRAESAWIQRIMRIATVYDPVNFAKLIAPADTLTATLWQNLIKDEGGEFSKVVVDQQISTEIIEAPESDLTKNKDIDVISVIGGTVSNIDGFETSPEDDAYARFVYADPRFEKLIGKIGHADTVDHAKEVVPLSVVLETLKEPVVQVVRDISQDIKNVKNEIERLMISVVYKKHNIYPSKDNQKLFQKYRQQISSKIYPRIGMKPNSRKDQIQNFGDLCKFRDILENELK